MAVTRILPRFRNPVWLPESPQREGGGRQKRDCFSLLLAYCDAGPLFSQRASARSFGRGDAILFRSRSSQPTTANCWPATVTSCPLGGQRGQHVAEVGIQHWYPPSWPRRPGRAATSCQCTPPEWRSANRPPCPGRKASQGAPSVQLQPWLQHNAPPGILQAHPRIAPLFTG